MKIILVVFSIIGAATVISSLPLVEDSIYKELAKLDAYSDAQYERNDRRGPFRNEPEKVRNFGRSTMSSQILLKKQDIKNLYQKLVGVGSKILSSVGDYLYDYFSKKYGIDDELHKVVRGIADIFRISAGLSNADSHIIDFKVKDGITNVRNILEGMFSYIYGRVIRKENFDISDCKQVDSNVVAPDGWGPLFQVLKLNQQNFTCLFFKKAERDNSLTTADKNMYKNFFDLVIKLYETKYLTADVDKTNLRKSLNYFLEQVNKLNFSLAYRNDVKMLTNTFFKLFTGEHLTVTDKASALKSFFTLFLAAQFRGISIYSNLLYNRQTAVFLTSLSPIAMKIGLREYINGLKERKHINLSSNTRMILNQLLPTLNNLMNNILQNFLKFFGMQPKLISDMQLRRRVAIIQKVSEHSNRRAFVSQQRPDYVTAAAILQLMLTDEYEGKGKGFRFMENREAEQATVQA